MIERVVHIKGDQTSVMADEKNSGTDLVRRSTTVSVLSIVSIRNDPLSITARRCGVVPARH